MKRKSPQSQLCLGVNIRVKKKKGLFTVVEHGWKYPSMARKFWVLSSPVSLLPPRPDQGFHTAVVEIQVIRSPSGHAPTITEAVRCQPTCSGQGQH